MLGLVYLTSVAGLIATSAVLHQLSQSRCGHTLLPPLTHISTTHLHTSNLNSEAPPAAQNLHCCVLANKSLNCHTKSLKVNQSHCSPSAVSQTSLLCLWGSLLASMGHIHPETDSDMEAAHTWSPASFLCPGCLALLPSLQCRPRNTSALVAHTPFDYHQHRAPRLASSLHRGVEPSLNSRLRVFAPVQMGPCHPDSLLHMDKAQALLMPG